MATHHQPSIRKPTAIDSVEQYKRELQLQIEQNRRRKEEERQRELEMERKEMEKFDEYRRKVRQEMEEEERKEKEKILAAQRKAARIRALQEEAEAANRKTSNRATRDSDETIHRDRLSGRRRDSDDLEWWEKKKGVNDATRKSVQSPVIPALRHKNEGFASLRQNTASETSINNGDVSENEHSGQSTRSRSSSRKATQEKLSASTGRELTSWNVSFNFLQRSNRQIKAAATNVAPPSGQPSGDGEQIR